MRSAAILLVLAAHVSSVRHSSAPWSIAVGNLGSIGVETFFVLSGYLIGRILCRQVERNGFAKVGMLHFWKRRWYRTLPNYLLCLVTLCVTYRVLHIPIREPILPYFLFTQNFVADHSSGFFSTSWSLSVEEWAYLLLPVLISASLVVKSTRRPAGLLLSAITMIAVPTLLRLGANPTADWDGGIRKIVVYRLDAIGYGVLLAYLSLYQSRIFKLASGPHVAAFSVAVLAALYANLALSSHGPFGPTIWSHCLWISAFSFFLMPVIGYASTVLNSALAPLRHIAPVISAYSYSLYLWHLPVLILTDRFWYRYSGPVRRPMEALVIIACTCLVSWLAYHGIEQPFMRLRDRGSRQ